MFAEAGLGDVQLVAVLSYGTAGDFVATFVHFSHQLVIGQRLTLVLGIHAFTESLLQLPGGDLLTLLVLKTFGEEIL